MHLEISGSNEMQELCGNGGIMFVAHAILRLNVTSNVIKSTRVVAAISRMKAKILSIVSLGDLFSISWRIESYFRINYSSLL